jgi:mxaA protein
MQIYSPIISTDMWQPEPMKNLLTILRTRTQQCATLCLGLLLLTSTLSIQADEARLPEIDKKYVRLSTVEPVRDSGYTVGDLITRTVIMEVKKPYKLLDTSLPIVGYEKRYQGQVIGDIKKIEEEKDDSTVYTITLTYQIFTRNVVAKPAALPPEFVKIQGEKEVYAFRIPSWNFRISPIAVFGEVKLETDMSPFRGPLLKTDERERLTFKIALTVLALSALGLLYILGVHAWLPRMGGPFARAYRELRKLKKLAPTDETFKLGLTAVHKAFNRSNGNSVFSDDVDAFIANKPVFAAIRPEIEQFFALSRQMFFDQSNARPMGAEQHEWLRQFTRRCRDCERGLRPEKQA